jgi:hypothetical protein
MIDPQDFQDSEPDILANSASAIIQRIKETSDQCAVALRSLCRRKKSLAVEVHLLALMLYFHVHNLKLSFLCMGCSSFKNMSKFIISLRKRIARHMLFFLFSCCVQCQDLINTCYITCCSKARHCEYDISCSYVG